MCAKEVAMLLMHYRMPPHLFAVEENAEAMLECPCCGIAYAARDTVFVEAVAQPAFNDRVSKHDALLFCSMRCVLLSMGGGSRC
jgi:hypothetical protein